MSVTSLQQDANIFELIPGSYIDVQINYPIQVRLKLLLIGYELGKYIILKHPALTEQDNYRDVLIEGNVAIARYILEGNKGQCFAFRSTIRHITNYPEKFLVLNYPNKLEKRELRMQQRHITHLPATVMIDGRENKESNSKIKGIIADISTKGCGFIFKSDNAKIKVNQCDVFICIQTPSNGEAKIPGRVCNSRNEQGKVNVGIKFNDADKQVLLLLENLFIDANMG
ncbi:MAG: flagellar brake protein [Colwellia sp.]